MHEQRAGLHQVPQCAHNEFFYICYKYLFNSVMATANTSTLVPHETGFGILFARIADFTKIASPLSEPSENM